MLPMPPPTQSTESSTIEVLNVRNWTAEASKGRFRVYIDGKAAGWVNAFEPLRVPVAPGRHIVRIRGTYWFSPRVPVDVTDNENRRMVANTSTDKPLALFFLLMRHPMSAFSLTLLQPGPDDLVEPPQINSAAIARKRRATLVFSVVLVLELILFAVLSRNASGQLFRFGSITLIAIDIGILCWFVREWRSAGRL
jgi:hypothetical protein